MPKKPETPSYLNFDAAAYPWKPDINYRKHPEKYRVGKGEQGVLICEPYKSEMTPLWRFRDVNIARSSAKALTEKFRGYMKEDDFAGADLARKFLQMGYTRARRYANYKGGRKYDKENHHAPLKRGTGEKEKAKAAEIFYRAWRRAEDTARYKRMKAEWKKKYG